MRYISVELELILPLCNKRKVNNILLYLFILIFSLCVLVSLTVRLLMCKQDSNFSSENFFILTIHNKHVYMWSWEGLHIQYVQYCAWVYIRSNCSLCFLYIVFLVTISSNYVSQLLLLHNWMVVNVLNESRLLGNSP